MEILDIYDENGNVTEKTIIRKDKSIKLAGDEYIAISMIFIENSNHEFLIQQNSIEKGSKYSSTGGHVIHNETPIVSMRREIREELGIEVNGELLEICRFKYGKSLRFVYYLNKNIDLTKLKLQEDEVSFVKYLSIDEINKLIEEGNFIESHAIAFKKILENKAEKD